jgi:hypothetical protein
MYSVSCKQLGFELTFMPHSDIADANADDAQLMGRDIILSFVKSCQLFRTNLALVLLVSPFNTHSLLFILGQ